MIVETDAQPNVFFIPHARLEFEIFVVVFCYVSRHPFLDIPHSPRIQLPIPSRSLYNPISVDACDNMYEYEYMRLQARWFLHFPLPLHSTMPLISLPELCKQRVSHLHLEY